MASLGDLMRLARPHFLVGGLAFHGLGLALAAQAGVHVPVAVALAGQAFVTLVQLGVHFGNEFHDLAADRANPTRTWLAGGSRVLVDGRVPPATARRASQWAFGLALPPAVALLLQASDGPRGTGLALAVAAGVLLLSIGYSAPPLRLHSRGVGELAAGVVVAGLVPLLPLAGTGATLQPALLVLAPMVLQVAALVTVLSLPDSEGDGAVGKRTLAVRLGGRATRRLVQLAWLLPGLGSVGAIAWGAPPAFALMGGAAFAASVALPVLVLRRSWDVLALVAVAVVALQWGLTTAWALRLL